VHRPWVFQPLSDEKLNKGYPICSIGEDKMSGYRAFSFRGDNIKRTLFQIMVKETNRLIYRFARRKERSHVPTIRNPIDFAAHFSSVKTTCFAAIPAPQPPKQEFNARVTKSELLRLEPLDK